MSTGFLSSLTREHADLRRELHEACTAVGGLYVDEIDHPRTFPLDDPLEAVDDLLVEIRNAELFVCILGGSRHGTLIEGSRVSYFEIELYQAALLQKRPLILVLPSFSPESHLAEVLDLLRFSLPSSAWIKVPSGAQVVALVTQRLDELRHRSRWCRIAPRIHLRRFVTGMWRRRAASNELDEGRTPLRFLDGRMGQPGKLRPSEVQKWAARAIAETDQERRLARLWIAVKEMIGASYSDPSFEEYAPLWDDVLGLWAKAAAWYGLHGHMPLGRLAALKSLEDVRQRMRATPRFKSTSEALADPSGALASAHYSIGKLLMSHRGRRWHFEEAHRHIRRGLQDAQEGVDGLLAIRGNINLHTGHLWAAVRDHEQVLRIRETNGAAPAAVGEALAELGFAYLLTGSPVKGRRMIRDGFDLLEKHGERGFYLRAIRKLSVAEYLTGHWRDGRSHRHLLRAMADEANIRDQVKWL